MKVFVTGATGFIGSAVVPELINAGHKVIGLARSDASAGALEKAGARVHRGSLEDLESLRRGAAAADGVIHLAFIHDFSKYASAGQTDKRAIEAMGAELRGKKLVVASGVVGGLKKGTFSNEDYKPGKLYRAILPRKSEEAALSLVSEGVNASVVGLPPTVHGDGDKGFIKWLINIASKKGVSAYVGKGLNRWPSVHRLDAACLFRLVLEKGAAGARYNAVADEGVRLYDIAVLIGRRLNVPIASKSHIMAFFHFGRMLGLLAGLDLPASSKLTQERLGWHPVQPGLITDLEQGSYFKALHS